MLRLNYVWFHRFKIVFQQPVDSATGCYNTTHSNAEAVLLPLSITLSKLLNVSSWF